MQGKGIVTVIPVTVQHTVFLPVQHGRIFIIGRSDELHGCTRHAQRRKQAVMHTLCIGSASAAPVDDLRQKTEAVVAVAEVFTGSADQAVLCSEGIQPFRHQLHGIAGQLPVISRFGVFVLLHHVHGDAGLREETAGMRKQMGNRDRLRMAVGEFGYIAGYGIVQRQYAFISQLQNTGSRHGFCDRGKAEDRFSVRGFCGSCITDTAVQFVFRIAGCINDACRKTHSTAVLYDFINQLFSFCFVFGGDSVHVIPPAGQICNRELPRSEATLQSSPSCGG